MFEKGRNSCWGDYLLRGALNECIRKRRACVYVFVVHGCVFPTVLVFLGASGDGVAAIVVRIATLVGRVAREVDMLAWPFSVPA